tara:strand:+ start:3094 stop:4620 length:1527 start_codon:yes stop_codon:yes gene_type:complete
MKKFYLNGYNLTARMLTKVSRGKVNLDIEDECWTRIKKCRDMVEEKIEKKEPMYGINTGIGEFSEVTLDEEQTQKFQNHLVYSHAAGIGKAMPKEIVRGAMCGRINVHCKGFSGGRREITEKMIEILNSDVVPYVCEKGSVGACGDLAPMSQIALTMMGEGDAFYKDKLMSAKNALAKAKIKPLKLAARDGLSIINGSNVLTALSALILNDAKLWLKTHDLSASMTLEALNANMKPYKSKLHELRGFTGSKKVAKNITNLTEGSEILNSKNKKLQDAYSLRSTPQVAGTLRDSLSYTLKQVEIELNGVGDNPIFLPEEKEVLTGANFQGTPVALPMEMIGVGLSMVGVLSERRMNRLVNPALSGGLPPFLTEDPGFNSGLMVSQYTADALCVENRILSHPAANQSIPAAADQEDFVSMGLTTAQKTKQILENCWGILAIEMLASAQAIELRKPEKPSPVINEIITEIRKSIKHLDDDRPLFDDHNKMVEILKSGKLIQIVEKNLGKLE